MRATLLVFSLALQSCAVAEAPSVHTNGEHLQGQWTDDSEMIAVFKGVPFATPPIEELRWRAPRSHTPRSGPQQATEFAPGCNAREKTRSAASMICKSFFRT